MRYAAFAIDYDGTLAREGSVDPEVLEQLDRVRASGRRLVLVTGRELEELLAIFPGIDRFDLVVAENGALLYRPASGERELLAPAPSVQLVEALRARGVWPLSVGKSIIATVEPYETAVLEAIRDLGLEQNVIFNKGAVMILPSGVNKATGLVRALSELGLSPRNAVAIGDGENDHALLEVSEYACAVANAIPTLREQAHRVTQGIDGDGVMEIIADLIDADLAGPTRRPGRTLVLGQGADTQEVCVPSAGSSLIVTGDTAARRLSRTHALVTRLIGQGYQCCILDTAGVHARLQDVIVLGDARHPPDAASIVAALEKPEVSVVADLTALGAAARADLFTELSPGLYSLRRANCRPHWLVLDDAAELLSDRALPRVAFEIDTLYVAADIDALPQAVHDDVDAVIGEGGDTAEAVRKTTPPPPLARETQRPSASAR